MTAWCAPLDRILRGTTVIRASELAPKLVEEGHIAGFEFCTITRQELLGAKEMMEFGGGGIVPIVELDGQPIGEGRVGPATKASSKFYKMT